MQDHSVVVVVIGADLLMQFWIFSVVVLICLR
jgi:hypothetical protein